MRRFPLLWYFLGASFVAITVVTIGLAIILNGRAQSNFVARSESQGTTEVIHTLQMFYYNILAPQLENDPDLAIEDAVDPMMMSMFAGRTTFGLNTVSITVHDPQGRLVYSTDPQVGAVPENEQDLFQQAVQGTSSADLVAGTQITGLDGERRELDAVRSYRAITDVAPDSGQEGSILGVLSISQDVTEAYAAARSDALWNAVMTSLAAGGVLFLILFGIVFRADRVIAQGHKRMRGQQENLNREVGARKQAQAALEEMNKSLEEKVRLRTEELALANEELQQRNRELLDARAQAAVDALTDLWNHRTFQERIKDEVSRAQENGDTVGLVMLDIDDFKQLNDSQGHLAGDQILREFAITLGDVAKPSDAYRYGGDEFAILVPGADRRKAAALAERLRRSVERRRYNGNNMTVSLGVASFPETAGSAQELLYGADSAMYWAKCAGKNHVSDWNGLLDPHGNGDGPWYVSERGVRSPDIVAALVTALAAKDPLTRTHAERCSWYALKVGEELGLSQEETSAVQLAALLHDIGKLVVPDELLTKPGPLSEDEWEQMKQHPAAAREVLSQIRAVADATPAIVHHHEHFNGSGYPGGLSGENIPIVSRILSVTDAFDAMTTDRPYRNAMSVEDAIEELRRNSGSQFDPAIVDAFLEVLSRHDHQPPHFTASAEGALTAGVAPGERPEQE